jgi:DNA-binding MarR family transcriptional regulator
VPRGGAERIGAVGMVAEDRAVTAMATERAVAGERVVAEDAVVTAWRQMAACHAAACAALERELGERHGLGVSDFEVLERLAESEERRFRAQDLAEAVHLSQSALSRLVDRLARHGLVERCGCEGDRRGIYVVLTEAGERRHADAVPTHRDVLARTLPAAMLTRGITSSGSAQPGSRG